MSRTGTDDRCLEWIVRHRIALWIVAGVVLMIGLGTPPVTRTQEARVLETARQMLGQPFERWMIPRLNGELRLEKPPLAYWYTAAAFSIGGVNDFVGRLPTALLAWLTLAATYFAAARLYGKPVGILAAGMLMSCLLFARLGRFAETDLPATLFITLAIGFHLAALRPEDSRKSPATPGLLHASAASIALAALAKGLPCLFAIIFIIASCLIERRRDVLRRYFTSGAIATFLLLLLPWYAYVLAVAGGSVFAKELLNTAEGGNHGGLGFEYLWVIAWGAAPWSVFFAVSIGDLIKRRKSDVRSRLLLIWLAAILIPLLLNGNKQKHYLLPMMPAIATAAAWWAIDVLRRSKLSFAAAGALAAIIPLAVETIAPRFDKDEEYHARARIIREKFGDAPMAFYGPSRNLILCFELQRNISYIETDDEARRIAAQSPQTVLISIGAHGHEEPHPPSPYREVFEFDDPEHEMAFFVARRS